jgi:hypothetical protein
VGSGTYKVYTVWDQAHRKCAVCGIRYIESVPSMESGT